jgi:glycosyltransferase involved in cell wall biosynthesis
MDGIRVIRVPNHSMTVFSRFNLSSPAGYSRTLAALLHEAAVDVIHCHELRTPETLCAARLARRSGVPLVISPHGTLPHATGWSRVKHAWDSVLARHMLPAFDQVVALTEAEAVDAGALWARYGVPLDPAQISVVPNGVDPATLADRPDQSVARARWNLGDGPVVLFMGRLTERKGVGLLVNAFKDVVRDFQRARLLIVGPDEGAGASVRAAVRQLGLSEQIIFAGMLSGRDRLSAYAAADVFALPAVGEGFSIAALEALACGVPAVLSPECNFSEVAEEGAGLIVQRTRGEWARSISGLLGDSPRLSRMGACGRELVSRRYTWTRISARMDAAYRGAIDRRGMRPS